MGIEQSVGDSLKGGIEVRTERRVGDCLKSGVEVLKGSVEVVFRWLQRWC